MTNKSITLTVLGIAAMACVTVIGNTYLNVKYRPSQSHTHTSITDNQYTHCLSVVMSESRQSGKVIDIEQAQKVCEGIQKQNANKKGH